MSKNGFGYTITNGNVWGRVSQPEIRWLYRLVAYVFMDHADGASCREFREQTALPLRQPQLWTQRRRWQKSGGMLWNGAMGGAGVLALGHVVNRRPFAHVTKGMFVPSKTCALSEVGVL